MASSSSSKRKNILGQRQDPGWEHGFEVENNPKKVKCRYCDKIHSGGIYRHKHHLAGTKLNVEACTQVPDDVRKKFIKLLQDQMHEVEKKRRVLRDTSDECDVEGEAYEMSEGRSAHSQGNIFCQKNKGVMDAFVKKKSFVNQTTINVKFKRAERDDVCQTIARLFYTSAIPFNVVNNPLFPIAIKKIGEFGRGLKPPSYHEIRETFLKKEVLETRSMLQTFKEEWSRTGCSIMSDGWSDKKNRSLCNFLVNSPQGTIFLSSRDTSHISKTADKIFEMLDEIVEKVGEENVVQVVTDNATNYKAAGELLMQKRTKLFWTPCAAHCVDLILEDFEKKIKVHQKTISDARAVVSFIYNRTLLTCWMKEFTKGTELIRPAVTRFATSYLTLQRLHEQKSALYSLFTDMKWRLSRFARTEKGKKIEDIVLDNRVFWKNVESCLKASLPLVKVLRLVDSDARPAMGFLYEAMDRAKEEIQRNFNNVPSRYQPIWEIIDERWESQLHQPLHAAAFFLNPQLAYNSPQTDSEVKLGLYSCLQRMVPDVNMRVTIDLQMDQFKQAKGLFGLETAILTRNKKSPADWWQSYGDDCPELKNFAIRILSLTCSSSGCERNWSAFEMVHTKRRNRLHQKKLNDLVFVMYNLKMKERNMNRKTILEPILLEDLPSDDEWLTEKEAPVLPTETNWLSVLDKQVEDGVDEEEDAFDHDLDVAVDGENAGTNDDIGGGELDGMTMFNDEDDDIGIDVQNDFNNDD